MEFNCGGYISVKYSLRGKYRIYLDEIQLYRVFTGYVLVRNTCIGYTWNILVKYSCIW